ncbi:MAG: hypothetical protein IPI67_38930 [Myxococcales bacterium]|nr:hypothetical protein [Myxococcales bacterium]
MTRNLSWGSVPAGARLATLASAAMIAQQVAGKATRDALFLSTFGVTALPAMMAVSALLSLVVAFWLARMTLRHSPAKIVPALFGASGVLLLGLWALSFSLPRLAAILLYAHTALFGATVISAFWSLMNEAFDPHAGKRAVAWIAAGGTLGGVLGGIAAWRASTVISVPTMLPLLAGTNFLCVASTYRMAAGATRPRSESAASTEAAAANPLRSIRDAPYLRNLGLIVALAAITSGLLDYVFSSEAMMRFATAPELLAFFAVFWLVVGVLSFVVQLSLGRLAVEKLGLALTVALLPAVVVLGGAVGLAVPGLGSTAILRGGEAMQKNSLFRTAYELLYTPISEEKKRSTKMLIDVGFDRVGTVLASAITALVLWLVPGRTEVLLLVVAIGCALVTVTRLRPLHRGYVRMLEQSLRKGAEVEPVGRQSISREGRAQIAAEDALVEQLEDRRAQALPESSSERPAELQERTDSLDEAIRAVIDLRSGNPQRVRRVLSADGLAAPLVSFAIALLADKQFHLDAIRALRKVATRSTGQLLDALCDENVEFDVRRRIPRVLSVCSAQRAADGLVRGLSDERFEVRYACSRALVKVAGPSSGVVVSREVVTAIVLREASLGKEIWEGQTSPPFDEEEDDAPGLFERLQQDRIDRSLEHVFNVIALHVDPASLRIAFLALHADDLHHRGTALEYLETVLPDEIREAVWPYLGGARPMRPARPAQEILADLTYGEPGTGPSAG